MEKIKINSDRIWIRINEMGTYGADVGRGVSRFAWEKPYKMGILKLVSWAEEAGLQTRMDSVGNVFIRLPGEEANEPAVLSGSHFDTVPHGGYFDGMAGVMGTFEAILSIKASGKKHKKPIELVAFINEEASQFLGGTFGSKAICGMLPKDYAMTLKNREKNQTLAKAMIEYDMGLRPDKIEASIIQPENYCAFIEMHIEQGRYLLDRNLPMAIVSDIAGIKQFYITIHGVAAHAGGMSMEDRHDAVAAAAMIISEVENLAKKETGTRGTVGFIQAHPGEHNIIADQCMISVDFREADDKKWEKLYSDLIVVIKRECKKRGLTYDIKTTCNNAPAHCSQDFIQLMIESLEMRKIPYCQMVSFPAHDAMNMSRILPMGMIFLRSGNGGVSHCPEEYTTKEDLTKGTEVLADVLYELAK